MNVISSDTERKLEELYRRNIWSYFDDRTKEGQLFKYAKLEEDAFILEHILKQPHEYVQRIYEEEYRKMYSKPK